MKNLLSNIKVTRCTGYVVAGTTNQKGAIVDMAGFDGCLFIAQLGTMLNTGTIELAIGQAATNSSGAMVESKATSGEITSDGTDNVFLAVDVYRPRMRYLEPHLKLGAANSLVESVFAIQYKGRKMATTQADAVLAAKTFQSPGAA